jgi:hypothetical protein
MRFKILSRLGMAVVLTASLTVAVSLPVAAAPPSNDYFANATPSSLGTVDELSTAQATLQTNEPEPSCQPDIGHSVWYVYEPSDDEFLHADTYTSNYDTVLAVYDGTSLNNLVEVACSDDTDDVESSVEFWAYYGETYYLQVAGYRNHSGILSFYLDTAAPDDTAPTVTQPRPSVRVISTLGAGPGSTQISWSGYDDQSGIWYYELQRSVNGGSWEDEALPAATSTTVRVHLDLNSSVQFRVRATDYQYNTSAFRLGPSFTPVLYEDNNPAVTYSNGWTRIGDSHSSGGTRTYSIRTGARASLSFTGRTVAFVAVRSPYRGIAKVYIDGVLVASPNLYFAKSRQKQVVFERDWNSVGSHTIAVVVKGTSGHPKVDVDAFLVLQ